MAIDLLFSSVPATSGALVFGDDGTTAPARTDATIALVAGLPGLVSAIPIRKGNRIALAGAFPGLNANVLLIGSGRPKFAMLGNFPALGGEVPVSSKRIQRVALAAELPALSGVVGIALGYSPVMSLTGSFPALSGYVGIEYDNHVTNWLDSRVMSSFQPALPEGTGVTADWALSVESRRATQAP